MKPLLVFDYDGTIHDTIRIYEDAFRACHHWLIAQGYALEESVPAERIRSWLGMNVHDMWNSFLPHLPEEIKAEAAKRIGDRMLSAIHNRQAKWYNGAKEVLDVFKQKDYPMILLSNCRIFYRQANWEVFSMEQWFQAFYDCESYGFRPKTEIIHEILPNHAGSCIVIGDRKADLDCARSCGSPFIGCLYGYSSPGELDGADALAVSILDLPQSVEQITATFS